MREKIYIRSLINKTLILQNLHLIVIVRKREIETQIMDILSMTNLRDDTELTIHQLPKDSELVSNIKAIKTNQTDLNASLLINIRIQEMNKQHALNIYKYIQIFLQHLSIIKNKYNVITQTSGFASDYVNKVNEKLQLGWNKYENTETLINLDNEYSSLYKLMDSIKKEEPTTFKNLIGTLDKLYATDPFFENCQEFMTLLSDLQFQTEKDSVYLLIMLKFSQVNNILI